MRRAIWLFSGPPYGEPYVNYGPPPTAPVQHHRPAPSPPNPRDFVDRPPGHLGLKVVPQGTVMVVERLGKYHRTLQPGLHTLIPLLDRICYSYKTKEQGILIPYQSAVTADNVMVEVDGVLFVRVVDPVKASYNIENPIFSMVNLAQTTMRSEIGKLKFDKLFEQRAALNISIADAIKAEANEWGMECKWCEIRDVSVSDVVRIAMDLQTEAERRKRKQVIDSEAERAAEVNRAEGRKSAAELQAEAEKYAAIQKAEGQAKAVELIACGMARSVEIMGATLSQKCGASDAVATLLADRYIEAMGKLATGGNNTFVLSGGSTMPSPSTVVTDALSTCRTMGLPQLRDNVASQISTFKGA